MALPVKQQATNQLYKVYNALLSSCNTTLTQTWMPSTNAFTIDFWVQFNGIPSGSMALLSETASSSDNWSIYLNSNSELTMQFTAGGVVEGSYTMSTPWNLSSSTWYHLAFERSGSTALLFINGVSQPLTASTAFGANDLGEVYAPVLIGRCPGTADFNGWMDEFRIDKGVRFTTNFTPPKASYVRSTYDVLLLPFDSTFNPPTNTWDLSIDWKMVTYIGNAHLTNDQLVFGANSMRFGGNGDYLLVQDYWQAPFPISTNALGAWLWDPPSYILPTLVKLSLMYRLTGSNQYLLGTNLCFAASQLAQDAVNAQYTDGVFDDMLGGIVEVLGMSYDWLYDLMTPTERSNIVRAIELNCTWSLYRPENASTQGFWADLGTTVGSTWNLTVTNSGVNAFGAGKNGLGHPWANANWALEAALAVYSESTNQDLWDLLTIGMNYMLAKDSPFCYNSGSGINTGASYAYNELQCSTPKGLFFHSAFPEAGLNRNPIYTNMVAWFDWMLPVGFQQANWPWGDVGYGRGLEWVLPDALGWPLTALTGSGTAYAHWQNQLTVYGNTITQDTYPPLMIVSDSLTNYLNAPDTSSTAQWFPEGGWVMGATYRPDSFQCFTNGVGFIFQARPGGTDFEHDHLSDLSFQMWAYGSVITDAGDGNAMSAYAKVPMAHYALLVNGIGEGQTLIQNDPCMNQILAYETTSNYTYTVADGTAAYPTTTSPVYAGWLYPNHYLSVESGGPLIGLTKVQRHILFMRQQGYFIVYDDLADNNNVTFTWLYHVLENTLTGPDTTTFSNCLTFTYTSDTQAYTGLKSNWPPVTVYVSHIANASQLSVTNMSGTNVRSNPITGENYWGTNYGTTGPLSSAPGVAGSGVRANALWISNQTPTNTFHFMTVIYPVRPGGTAPQITRLDDYTVAVTNGTQGDVVSFDPNTKFPATLIVNALNIPVVQAIPPVQNFHIIWTQ
jgi:hypothetical protein